MITYNAVRKRERPQLLATLDNIISSKEDETLENLTITNTSQERLDSPKDFMEKYEPLPAIEF